MKLLFISASKRWEGRTYREYPYGIGILSTLANEAGHSVYILDMAVDDKDYVQVVKEFQPDVIAIAFMSPSVLIAREVIRRLDTEFDIPIIAGGIHSTLYPEAVLNYGADIVMLGEGELTFVDVLHYIRDNPPSKLKIKLSEIPNLVYRNAEGKIEYTRRQSQSVDLNSLPVMNRNLFDLKFYPHHSLLTSRCCPYQCRFCCSWAPGGSRGRIMHSGKILDSLEWLTDNYGAFELYWGDEIFFWSRKERMTFCRVLKERKFPIKFIVQLRADLIDAELVEALAEAGCTKICIGAESGSDKLLKTANKRVTAAQVEKAIKECVKGGVACKTWWMVGLPGGGKEEQLKSLEVIDHARPNEVAVHQFVPLPGSEFWNRASEFGIRLPSEASFENLNYYSDPRQLSYDYISGEELYDVLKIYEEHLIRIGYVPTDKAVETSKYVFTTPFQKKTFNI